MLGKKFTELIDICLQRLDQGEDLLEILADYPEYQERIKPLLLVAMASRAFPVPIPKHTAKRMGKYDLLAEMAQLEGQRAFRKTSRIPSRAQFIGNIVSSLRSIGINKPAPNFRLVMVALIMVFGTGFFVLNASAGGNPGDLVSYLSSNYQSVLQIFEFDGSPSDEFPFGQFHFFSGRGLGFDDQLAHKVTLLVDIEDDDQYQETDDKGEGDKNQNRNGQDTADTYPADPDDPKIIDNSGLALGHDKEKDNNGLALGHDQDPDDPGLALGHDQDPDDPGLALGQNKGVKVKEDKEKEDKVKEDKVKEDKIKDKIDEDD